MVRNTTLDYSKLVLSIMIIILHFPLGEFGEYEVSFFYENVLGRMAVPIFFIINGYYLQNLNFKKLKKYLTHLIIIYLVWQLFYMPFCMRSTFKSFIFDMIVGYEHLWYVSSLIGAAIIFYIYQKISDNKLLLFVISILLFAIGYVIQLSYLHHYFLYRNMFFFAFPFISIGYLIRGIDVQKYKNLAYVTLIVALIFSYFEIHHITEAGSDLMISLLIVCPAIFILILAKSKYSESDSYISDISAGIYFIHVFLIKMVILIPTNVPIIYFMPFTILLSILFANIIVTANKRINIFL